MVKTKRFKTIGAIPDDPEHEQSVQGLVINQIGSLDREEKELVNDNFPMIDVSELLILEEGREPASLLKSMGMTLGGLTLIVVGIGLFFVGRGDGS